MHNRNNNVFTFYSLLECIYIVIKITWEGSCVSLGTVKSNTYKTFLLTVLLMRQKKLLHTLTHLMTIVIRK